MLFMKFLCISKSSKPLIFKSQQTTKIYYFKKHPEYFDWNIVSINFNFSVFQVILPYGIFREHHQISLELSKANEILFLHQKQNSQSHVISLLASWLLSWLMIHRLQWLNYNVLNNEQWLSNWCWSKGLKLRKVKDLLIWQIYKTVTKQIKNTFLYTQ